MPAYLLYKKTYIISTYYNFSVKYLFLSIFDFIFYYSYKIAVKKLNCPQIADKFISVNNLHKWLIYVDHILKTQFIWLRFLMLLCYNELLWAKRTVYYQLLACNEFIISHRRG